MNKMPLEAKRGERTRLSRKYEIWNEGEKVADGFRSEEGPLFWEQDKLTLELDRLEPIPGRLSVERLLLVPETVTMRTEISAGSWWCRMRCSFAEYVVRPEGLVGRFIFIGGDPQLRPKASA